MRERKKWKIRHVTRVHRSLLNFLWKKQEVGEWPSDLVLGIAPPSPNGFDITPDQLANELSIKVQASRKHAEYNVVVHHADIFWDILEWNDVCTRKKGSCFICDLCLQQGEKEYFSNRNEMYDSHLWKPLFDWITDNYQQDKYVCLFQYSSGTWGRVITENRLIKNRLKEHYVRSFPVRKFAGSRIFDEN